MAMDGSDTSSPSKGSSAVRMRFYNFNMANSAAFEGLHHLQGTTGRCLEDWIQEPFSDGQSCDAVFLTFTETRLALGPWVREYRNNPNSKLDCATYQNSVKEAEMTNDMPWSGMLDGVAEKYNGNLKTLLLFSRARFRRDPDMQPLFGRLTDKRIGGMALPNPKKAFMGRSLLSRQDALHICFAGAHFPIAEMAAVLDQIGGLESAKVIMARTLRKVLRNAFRRGILSDNSLLVVQGDLNSRTVLGPKGQVKDILQEVISDPHIQAAIRNGVPVAEGDWFEPCGGTNALKLPVTYKFNSEVGAHFKGTDGSALSLEGILTAAAKREDDGAYAETLQSLPPDVLKSWSLEFKEANFRNFRFPASADRIICWAPSSLARRLQWTFPQGGYKVNHLQGGSDHRPVRLEVLLQLLPADAAGNTAVSATEPPRALLEAVAQDDAEDSEGAGGDSPSFLNRLGSAAQSWFSQQLLLSGERL